MGVTEIMEAKIILLFVDGEKKAEALHKLTHGLVDKMWPVDYLQEHREIHIFASENPILYV